jgi:hypothetical protein
MAAEYDGQRDMSDQIVRAKDAVSTKQQRDAQPPLPIASFTARVSAPTAASRAIRLLPGCLLSVLFLR